MNGIAKNQKGYTLIEVLCAIAILSVVAVASVTLLLFSIRTNSYITSGSSLQARSEQLDKRIGLLFKRADSVSLPETEEEDVLLFKTAETETALRWDPNTRLLRFGEEELSDSVLQFSVTAELPENDRVYCVQYALSEGKTYTKIFSVGK